MISSSPLFFYPLKSLDKFQTLYQGLILCFALASSPTVLAQVVTDSKSAPQKPQEVRSFPKNRTQFKKKMPLFEYGIGGGAVYTPDYPGSSEARGKSLFLPYFIYRGKLFQLGSENGARAVTIKKNQFELDLSMGGALRAESKKNKARQGMPNLDYLLEVGPQLIVYFDERRDTYAGTSRLEFRLPLRGVFSTDFTNFNLQGYTASTQLHYTYDNIMGTKHAVNVSVRTTWASQEFQDYLYAVKPEFVIDNNLPEYQGRINRPAYRALSGLLSRRISFVFKPYLNKRLRIFWGFSVYSYKGAANQDSPLFKVDHGWSSGLALLWTWGASKQTSNY